MTREEAEKLAKQILQGQFLSLTVPAIELAHYILAQSGAARELPSANSPAVPSEHGLQHAVSAPGEAAPDLAVVGPSSGDFRGSEAPSRKRGSVANFACCNQCSGEHHHCPGCGAYVKGESVVFCSSRCESAHNAV